MLWYVALNTFQNAWLPCSLLISRMTAVPAGMTLRSGPLDSVDYDMAVWHLVEVVERIRPMELEWPIAKFWDALHMDDVVAQAQL